MTKQEKLHELIQKILHSSVGEIIPDNQLGLYISEKLCEHPSLIIAFVEEVEK